MSKTAEKQTASQTVGANLKKLMKANNLTQEKFAEEFGTSPRTVRRWIKEFPNLTVLEQLAAYFNVSVTDLFSK